MNVLALGFFPTKMTDSLEIYGKTVKDDIMKNALLIKRVGRASDVGGAAVYLASEAGSWVTGGPKSRRRIPFKVVNDVFR